MAERPIWRGHLRLALVSCPISLHTARHDRGSLHFHFINPETGNRVRMITLDAGTDQELSRRDLAKGYEFKKDNYLLMNEEDFESARIDSSATLNVEKFVPMDSIDPIYFENSYFCVPDGDSGADVYAVLREAIGQTNRMALSRVVIARRERAVAIMPMERGLVVHTLHDSREVNDPKALFDRIPTTKPDPEMVKLATQLVDRQVGEFDPADMDDRYEARLREVIQAKLQGEGIEPEAEEDEDKGNVIDLMAALKKSLQGAEKPAAKVTKKPASVSKKPAKPAEAPPPAKAKPVRKRA